MYDDAGIDSPHTTKMKEKHRKQVKIRPPLHLELLSGKLGATPSRSQCLGGGGGQSLTLRATHLHLVREHLVVLPHPQLPARQPHVEEDDGVGSLHNRQDEAHLAASVQVVEGVEDAPGAPEHVHEAPDQENGRALAASDQAAEATTLLGDREPRQVGQHEGHGDAGGDVDGSGDEVLVVHISSRCHDHSHDDTQPELQDTPLLVGLAPVRLLALPELICGNAGEGASDVLQVLVTSAHPFLGKADVQAMEGPLLAAEHCVCGTL
mmetsp:Transcript_38361/g.57426  ORF Transcript_38361/g.57426 Transcript_38361/m.57426 type:complete len:265 (+) Transcript_38361:188-982(+)